MKREKITVMVRFPAKRQFFLQGLFDVIILYLAIKVTLVTVSNNSVQLQAIN